MRYIDKGEVHKDFHLATNETIDFVLSEYGEDFLYELFRRTAQEVYRDIYKNLKAGNFKPLLEHWEYYYSRENGKYEITEDDEKVSFYVTDCPAVRHLKEKNIPVKKSFYLQMIMLNKAWSEDTPFLIDTEIISKGEYRMTLRRKG